MKKQVLLVSMLIISALLWSSDLWSSDLQFFREDLSFTLTDSSLSVDGDYYFRNNSEKDIERLLFYPFPQDSLYGEVTDSFAITQDSINVLGKITTEGSFFKVIIPAGKERFVRVGYTHQLLANQAEYILLTTRNWGLPFEVVNYSLEFSKELKVYDFSLLPDDLTEDENKYYLSWHKEDFMPKTNFIVKFNKPVAE